MLKKYFIPKYFFIEFSNFLLYLPAVNQPSKQASTAFFISSEFITFPETGAVLFFAISLLPYLEKYSPTKVKNFIFFLFPVYLLYLFFL